MMWAGSYNVFPGVSWGENQCRAMRVLMHHTPVNIANQATLLKRKTPKQYIEDKK